jgi:hypothetical protein
LNLADSCIVVAAMIAARTRNWEALLAGSGVFLEAWQAIANITFAHIVLAIEVLVLDRALGAFSIATVS